MNWDLGKLYAGFDDPALARDAEEARKQIDSAASAVAALTIPADAKALSHIVSDLQSITTLLTKVASFTFLTLAVDANNEGALAFHDKVMHLDMASEQLSSALSRYLGSVDDLESLIQADPLLAEHAFMLREMKNHAAHTIDPALEPTVLKMQMTGGKAWVFPYYTDEGTLAFAMLPAHEVLPFWSDTAHTDLDCAVHFFPIYEYDEKGNESIVEKVEVFHAGGVERFIWKDGTLEADNDAASGSYVTVVDPKTQKPRALNWARIPLVCFKANHRELPLLCRVRCLQDALNLMLSNFVNSMEEDVHNTVLVIHNYDGEDLGEFRRNLATYGAVKVRTTDGSDGAVDTLEIEVKAENYKAVMELLKKAIIENARGYDAKDDRLNGTPNQMNIRSMYSDIDLDANGMETEFQAAFEDLLFFVNAHLANTGVGNFDGEDVTVIFNRDIIVNETEAIDNAVKSVGIISNETIIKQHPWIDDPEQELARIKAEKEEAAAEMEPYNNSFEKTMPNSAKPIEQNRDM